MPFSLQRNDITRVDADAYVLAANSELLLGGGVAGAIARAAGREELQAACDELGGCPVGGAVVTPGFAGRAKWIIHAVGPVWEANRDPEQLRALLKSAYLAAFARAAEVGAQSVAVPLLSAGIFGCPEEISLACAYEAAQESPAADDLDIMLVLFGETARNVARARFAEVAEYIDEEYVLAHRDRRRFEQSMAARPDYFGSAPEMGNAYGAAPQSASPASRAYPSAKEARATEEAEEAEEPVLKRLFGRKGGKKHAGEAARSMSVPYEVEKLKAIEEDASEAFEAFEPTAMFSIDAAEVAPPAEAPSAAYAVGSAPAAAAPTAAFAVPERLEDFLNRLDEPFSTTLLALIDARGLTDAEVYKRANLSRQHFAKIRSDAAYRPTKKTVLALAVALRLTLPETRDLLARAGFALSNASKADLIVRYYIERGNYDIFAINEALYAFDQPLLV